MAVEVLNEEDGPPGHRPKFKPNSGWWPDLNATQVPIFNDAALFMLVCGEKGSGKSWACAHKTIRHCYENFNALQLIVAPSARIGSEGVWTDLDTRILPEWKRGIGLEYTAARLDPMTKDRHRWIANMHGGWSKLLLVSIPYGTMVDSRVRGIVPSSAYVEELTNCDSEEYLTRIASQLGRKHGIQGPQQFVASCNPKGKKHWVYRKWFVENVSDPRWKAYHVPIKENLSRLPEQYFATLKSIWRTDPVEYERLIKGIWIDRPSGTAIFRIYFSHAAHVMGNPLTGEGLIPDTRYPIIVGYDPGPVNFCVTFMQLVPTLDKGPVYIVFDEINLVGQPMAFEKVVERIVEKMDQWNKRLDKNMQYEHIAPQDAFSHIRPSGSVDAKVIQNAAKGRIRLKACPRNNNSVPSRVRMTATLLQTGNLFISATCKGTIDMFDNLEAEKVKEDDFDPLSGFMPKRSPFLHPFDSLSYPIYYYAAHPSRANLTPQKIAPAVYRGGERRVFA